MPVKTVKIILERGKYIDKDVWTQIVTELEENKLKKISYEEFQNYISKFT